MRFGVGKRGVPGEDFEFDASLCEAADLIEFHADVEGDDAERSP